MIHHELDDLNEILLKMKMNGLENGLQVEFKNCKEYFKYIIYNELSDNVEVCKGIMYKYDKHNNLELKIYDEMIKAKKMIYWLYPDIKNDYICFECMNNKEIYINKNEYAMEAFCVHSNYIKDDILFNVDE